MPVAGSVGAVQPARRARPRRTPRPPSAHRPRLTGSSPAARSTCGRRHCGAHCMKPAPELLQLNIEDLDQAGCSAPVKSKGAKPRTRRRGPPHHEHVLRVTVGQCRYARRDRALGRRHRPTAPRPHSRPGVRHSPPTGARQVPRRPRRLPQHRPGPAVLRPGPRPARHRHRARRARSWLGSTRTAPLLPDPPRGIRSQSAGIRCRDLAINFAANCIGCELATVLVSASVRRQILPLPGGFDCAGADEGS